MDPRLRFDGLGRTTRLAVISYSAVTAARRRKGDGSEALCHIAGSHSLAERMAVEGV